MCKSKTAPVCATVAALQRDLTDRDAALGVAAASAKEWKALADERAGAMANMRIEIASLKTDLNKVRGWREKDQEVNSKLVDVSELAASRLEEIGGLLEEIVRLQEYGADRDQEIANLRRQLNDKAIDLGAVVGVSEVAACHCGDLQEQLANLHRAGKKTLKYHSGCCHDVIAFIEALTRAGDCLEGLAHE